MKKSILSPQELKILEAIADCLIPSSPKIPYKPSELQVAQEVNGFLEHVSGTMVQAAHVALKAIEWGASLFQFSMTRFTLMDETTRNQYLNAWTETTSLPKHALFRLLQALIFTAYYAHPKVTQSIGYQAKIPAKNPPVDLYGENVILGMKENSNIDADVCVVGSGAGGAAMASELSEKGLKVVILEEGGRFDLSNYREDAVHRTKWMYRDAGITPTIGNTPILIPLGKTIGGTTTINSGTCFRVPDTVLHKWEKGYGLAGWNSTMLSPYYDKVEKIINVMEIPEELLGNSARIIRKGLEKMGIQGEPLKRNMKGCEGSSLCCFGCPTDAKQSVQLNYIPNALKHGAKLYGHCRVQNLISEGDLVREVEAQFIHPITKEKGGKLRVRAKYVVIAAGSIYSPLLLKKSKLGLSSGQVGKNLTIHPAGKVFALFDEEVRGWEGVPQSFHSMHFEEQGIHLEGVFTPPSITSTMVLLRGMDHKRVMENFSHLANFGFLITDESRGRVWRKMDGEPLVTYFLKKSDLKKFIDSIVILARGFFEANAREVYLPIHRLPKLNSIEEISKIYALNLEAKDIEMEAFHPLGTCRMGADPKTSVVDEFGKVHGTQNLYITDGSVFPTSLGVNPQVTIMAFATRAAEHLSRNF